ncbi:hypothetical protein [Sphingomonas elodea]|uniref:hypothetical protein n=1 Tax=Sphingomonas elodea TaxID=179878 RepID=UPI0002631E24|nr:hypothetical protein [Sphingomonas elodea]
MADILLWDQRFPDRHPRRLSVNDTLASAAVRAGVAAPVNQADFATLNAGGALDPATPTEIVVEDGFAKRMRRIVVPVSVAAIALSLGIGASVGVPVTPSPTPTPTPAPTISQPSISPTSGTAGSTIFTGTDGTPTNGSITAREWLLNGIVVATGGVFAPTSGQTGTLIYRNTVSGAGGTASNTSTPVTIAAAAATAGALLSLTAANGTVTTDSGFSPTVTGAAIALKFADMGRRHPINDPVFDASKITLTVTDPGYDVSGGAIVPVTRTRTVKGTLPLKNPWPAAWTDIASSVPARSYCWSTAGGVRRAYYTEAGGTKGATAPSHTTDGQTVSDGGVLWTLVANNSYTGFVEQADGADVWVYAMLDMPIYAGSTITSITIDAGAYTVGATSSLAATISGAAITNSSTLPYPSVIPLILTPPHQRTTSGSVRVEVLADHGWGIHYGGGRPIAGIRGRAWNMARTTGSAAVDIVDTSLSTLVTTSSPGAAAVEVFPVVIDTSAVPAGDAFVELEFYPWLGTPLVTRTDCEGADWRGNQNYSLVGTISRNGANFYQLITPGTSAASGGPTGTTVDSAIVDGTCVWNYIGNDSIIQNSPNIPARWHFYNDPADAYKVGYCFVDPSGTATGTAGIFSTFAAADAAKGTLSNCYPTISAAALALETFNNTSGAGKTTHNDAGGGMIYLKAGTHSGFGSSLGTRPRGSVWLYVRADPAASAGSVVFAAGAVKANHPRMWFGEGIASTASGTGTANVFLDRGADNTTAGKRQVTGELVVSGLTTTQFDTAQPYAYRSGLIWTINCRINNAVLFREDANVQYRNVLVAGCYLWGSAGASAIAISTPNLVGNTIYGTNPIRDYRLGSIPTQFSTHADNRVIGRAATSSGMLVKLYASVAGNDTPALGYSQRGNLVKSTNYSGIDKCGEIAADGNNLQSYNVVQTYNTFVGQRLNYGYNDTNYQYHTQWYRGFNVETTTNTVFDSVTHGATLRNGLRCQNYWVVYDVASALNVNLLGSESGTVPGPNTYLGTRKDPSSLYNALNGTTSLYPAQFVQDTTSVAAGSSPADTAGDFRPVAGSVIVNKAARQAKKFDLLGVTRLTDGSGAVGAYERAS